MILLLNPVCRLYLDVSRACRKATRDDAHDTECRVNQAEWKDGTTVLENKTPTKRHEGPPR